jgi:hypothetical protein
MRAPLGAIVLVAASTACRKPPPDATPDFSDALVYVFSSFEAEEAELAFGLRALEQQVYAEMDILADDSLERSLSQAFLTEEDVAGLERPDRDLALALPVAVAGASDHPVDDQTRIAMLTDQTVVEPYSPDYFERTFLSGDDCWADRGCERMETSNDLIKDNLLMTIPYWFYKDYRWVDLALPDPGDTTSQAEDPRYGFVARSWTTEQFAGDSDKNWIRQSYTIEVWLPRDGRAEGAGSAGTGGGTLRLLALWTETDLGGISVSDDTIIGTARIGIDDNLDAQEEWLDANVQ